MHDAPSEVRFAPDSRAFVPEKLVSRGNTSAPVPLFQPEAQFSDEARQQNIHDASRTIQFYVDAEGMPQNLHVVKPAGYGLDEEALQAVMNYRFKPAIRDGMPVPVFLTVAVNFHRR